MMSIDEMRAGILAQLDRIDEKARSVGIVFDVADLTDAIRSLLNPDHCLGLDACCLEVIADSILPGQRAG